MALNSHSKDLAAIVSGLLSSKDASTDDLALILFTSTQWCHASTLVCQRLPELELPRSTQKILVDFPLVEEETSVLLSSFGDEWVVLSKDEQAHAFFRQFKVDAVPSFAFVSRKTGLRKDNAKGSTTDSWEAMEALLHDALSEQRSATAPPPLPSLLHSLSSSSSSVSDAKRDGMEAYNEGDMVGAARHFSRALHWHKQQHDASTTATAAATTTTTTTEEQGSGTSPPPPLLTDVAYNLGTVLLTCGKPLLAVPFLKDVILADPGDRTAHSVLGGVVGDLERAAVARAYNAIVQAQPNNSRAVHMLATLTGEGEAALGAGAALEYVAEVFDDLADVFEEKLVDHLEYRVPWQLLEEIDEYVASSPSTTTTTSRGRSAVGSWTCVDLGCGSGLCGRLFRKYVDPAVTSSSADPVATTTTTATTTADTGAETGGDKAPAGTDNAGDRGGGGEVGVRGVMVGVDVSPKMVAAAKRQGGYDSCFVEDIHATLDRFKDIHATLDRFKDIHATLDRFKDIHSTLDRFKDGGDGDNDAGGAADAVTADGGAHGAAGDDGDDDLAKKAAFPCLGSRSLDLVLSADTFIYVGDLHKCFALAARKLKRGGGGGGGGGLFAFSVELLKEEQEEENNEESVRSAAVAATAGASAEKKSRGFRLLRSGRYAHRHSYVNELASQYGFAVVKARAVEVRKEQATPIPGMVFVLEKRGGGGAEGKARLQSLQSTIPVSAAAAAAAVAAPSRVHNSNKSEGADGRCAVLEGLRPVVGDVGGFIDHVTNELLGMGFDLLASHNDNQHKEAQGGRGAIDGSSSSSSSNDDDGDAACDQTNGGGGGGRWRYEMDHVCFRCETLEEYESTCRALRSQGHDLLVASEVGGREISMFKLQPHPLRHMGWSVSCLEVPSPKPGRLYASGLEHAELVVKVHPAAFMRQMEGIAFDERAVGKTSNPDVSVSLLPMPTQNTGGSGGGGEGKCGGAVSVKFHERPIYEVVADELREAAAESAVISGNAALAEKGD